MVTKIFVGGIKKREHETECHHQHIPEATHGFVGELNFSRHVSMSFYTS
jgi:hypothetical protein